MTQNANILSFNEVKARGASAPRTVSKRSSHAHHAAYLERGGAYSQASSHASYSDYSQHQGLGHSSYQGSGRFSSQGSYYVQSESYGSIQDQKPGRFSSRGVDHSRFQNSGSTGNFGNTSKTDRSWHQNTLASHLSGSELSSNERGSVRAQRGASHEFGRISSRGQSSYSNRFSFADHTTHADHSFPRDSASRMDQSSRVNQSSHREQASRRGNASYAEHHEEGFFRGLQKRFRSAKAERDFNKAIGARERKAQEDAQRAQASRAAVYEMRMGATHRKSARMQNHDGKKSSFGGFGFSLPFNLSAGSLSAAAARGIVALAVVVFAVFMLYPSCQNYYVETRQLQQLQAEYDALNSYNTQMQSQIDYLNTDEGLEEYARSELGWIRQDEHMATVEGVESSVEGSTQSSTTHSPLNEDIPAPDTWYSGVLDVLFGYGK